MSIEYGKSKAVFREDVGIDEAEELVQWLHRTPAGKVDLSACAHMHPANLQVLMTANVAISAWPDPPTWRMWLESALHPRIGGM
jgi:hypothetical protein